MLKEYLSTLANKFREILGTTEPINAQDFEGKIVSVFAEGHQTGEIAGYQTGLAEGIEQGKQAEYDAFWNTYQENGNRTHYQNGFSGVCWNSENFRPKYPIVCKGYGSANCLFEYFDNKRKKPPLEIHEGDIDFNGSVTSMISTAQNAYISVFEMNAIPSVLNSMIDTFHMNDFGGAVLHTIKLGVREETTYSGNNFKCATIQNVSFVKGSIIGTNISFQYCDKLTHDSLMNIISVLKDYSGTGTIHTLTLHTNAKAILTDGEKAIATQKGWTIA